MKINNILFNIITLLIAIITICFGIYEYYREESFRVDILQAKLQLNNFHYADGKVNPNIRLTVIDTLGNVISDTQETDVNKMGNHLQREEIQGALNHGSGYAIKRVSKTNGEKYFYSATKIGDKIIRSSVPYSAPLTVTLKRDYTFLYYTLGILILIALVFYFRYQLISNERDKQRIKHQLTENVAHELKTPAATIEGYLETLISNPSLPKATQSEFIERCYAQSRRMSSLLQDMSMLSRLNADDSKKEPFIYQNAEIDISKIIYQIVDELKNQFDERRINIQIDIPSQLPFKGDPSLIYSLFANIFNNTLSYATNATYFNISEQTNNDTYVFTLSDNGPGVPIQHQMLIFERFYRIDKGRSRRLGGTGLGLAIVKNIALKYGGSVESSTTYGGGLTLKVSLKKNA